MISEGISTRAAIGVERIERYLCAFCGSEYDSLKEAKRCFATGFRCHVDVGDIIVGNRKYGWVEGDAPHWIYDHTDDRKKDGHHLSFGYRFYFVCVAITQDDHDGRKQPRLHCPIIHYITLAMKNQGGHASFGLYWRWDSHELAEKPENNYGAFKPPRGKIPRRVRMEAAELLKTKVCLCGFEGAHTVIGFKGKK